MNKEEMKNLRNIKKEECLNENKGKERTEDDSNVSILRNQGDVNLEFKIEEKQF